MIAQESAAVAVVRAADTVVPAQRSSPVVAATTATGQATPVPPCPQ